MRKTQFCFHFVLFISMVVTLVPSCGGKPDTMESLEVANSTSLTFYDDILLQVPQMDEVRDSLPVVSGNVIAASSDYSIRSASYLENSGDFPDPSSSLYSVSYQLVQHALYWHDEDSNQYFDAVEFSPDWEDWTNAGNNEESDPFHQPAYKIYRWDVSSLILNSDDTAILKLNWYGFRPITTNPDDHDAVLWIGLNNYTTNDWDWFLGPGESDDTLEINQLSNYVDVQGCLGLSVLVCGPDYECELGNSRLAYISLYTGESSYIDQHGIGQSLYYSERTQGIPEVASVTPLPSDVDLSTIMPAPKRQQIGDCYYWATVYGAMEYELCRSYSGCGWDMDSPAFQPSVRYAYNMCTHPIGRGLLDFLIDYGTSCEASVPYSVPYPEFYSRDYSQAIHSEALLLDIEDYWSLEYANRNHLISDIKKILAFHDRVITFAIPLDADFYDLYSGHTGEVIPPLEPGEKPIIWKANGPLSSNHYMCIVGYNDEWQAFKVRNSWGSYAGPISFGYDGYLWVSYDAIYTHGQAFNMVKEEFNPVTQAYYVGDQEYFPPTTSIRATEGKYADKIVVEWNPVMNSLEEPAEWYEIYRDSLETTPIATLAGSSPTVYDDYGAADGLSHAYWVVAKLEWAESTSRADIGFVTLED